VTISNPNLETPKTITLNPQAKPCIRQCNDSTLRHHHSRWSG